MAGTTGIYNQKEIGGEQVRAFVPHPLPPTKPNLLMEGELADRHDAALSAIGRLDIASAMVPSPQWFLYGFVRKEAVVSSQIEGAQSTLEDVLAFELSSRVRDVADVE